MSFINQTLLFSLPVQFTVITAHDNRKTQQNGIKYFHSIHALDTELNTLQGAAFLNCNKKERLAVAVLAMIEY